jgi:hypothetical protein
MAALALYGMGNREWLHGAAEDGLLQGGEGIRTLGANCWPTKP